MRRDKRANEPAGYVDHAEEINDLARHALRLETHDATYLARKISLGLSLQAIELAGQEKESCLPWEKLPRRFGENIMDTNCLIYCEPLKVHYKHALKKCSGSIRISPFGRQLSMDWNFTRQLQLI